MSDTTTRLREMLIVVHERGTHGIVDEQAVRDAIAELDRLREALAQYADPRNWIEFEWQCEGAPTRIAKEALK
jgi:hypothetical protein